MKTIAKILLIQLIVVSGFVANAQNGTGFRFNAEEYDKLPKSPEFGSGEKSLGNLKNNKKDLSPYAPDVIDQGLTNSCVAWSTAYYAYTIQRAYLNEITDRNEINSIALSAMYPYKSITENLCTDPYKSNLDIHQVADFMVKNGNLLHKNLSTASCDISITAALQNQAKAYTPIKGYQAVFDSKTKGLNLRNLVINEIDKNNRPVIVGMMIYKGNFEKLRSTDEYYNPSKGGTELSGHAMTVVGYDIFKGGGGAFKIVNSYGTKFGQSGYFWMKFADFEKYIRAAITLNLSDELPSFNTNQPNKKTEVGGKFGFLYLNSDTEKFESSEVPIHKGNGLYELRKRNWKVGQYFQLTTDNARSGQSVCVFSIDTKNTVTLHWPYDEAEKGSIKENPRFGMGVSDQMPTRNYKVVIPGEDKALVIEHAGTDYLCVLYSENVLINDIGAILEKIKKNNNPNVVARIKESLGDRLIPASGIKYQDSGMNFTASSTKGDTVPLILKVESVN
jgi:hypothetical protein